MHGALAEVGGAPLPRLGHLDKPQSAAAAATMKASGGVSRAIDTWNHGEDSPGTAALFAPFGTLEPHEKDQVCDLLAGSGQAEELWASALWISDDRNTVTVAEAIARGRQ